MILGTILGKETLDLEFKEFRFELTYNKDIDYKKIFENLVYLRKLINKIIIQHKNKYIEKYIHSFNNTNIKGTLLLGVSDEGEVIGYPIHKDDYESIHKNFKMYESKNVKVHFHKVDIYDYKKYFYQSYDSFINEMNKKCEEYHEYKIDFLKKKTDFINKLESVRLSINKLIHSGDKLGFLDYLVLNNVRHLYVDDPTIIYTDDIIKQEKYNPNHILYWATKYRDNLVNSILENKPKWDYSKKIINPYYRILQEFRPIHDYLSTNNFDFYVIEILVTPTEDKIYIYDNKLFIRRISPQGDPCCILETYK